MKPKQLRLVRVDPMDPAQVSPRAVAAESLRVARLAVEDEAQRRGEKLRFIARHDLMMRARTWLAQHPETIEEARRTLVERARRRSR